MRVLGHGGPGNVTPLVMKLCTTHGDMSRIPEPHGNVNCGRHRTVLVLQYF
jgi:hypothetical protein